MIVQGLFTDTKWNQGQADGHPMLLQENMTMNSVSAYIFK